MFGKIVVVSFFGLLVLGALTPSSPTKKTAVSAPAVSAPAVSAPVIDVPDVGKIDLTLIKWYKGGFENVMLIDAFITNKNQKPVKDLKVVCTSSAPSGTIIDRNVRTIYQTFPSGKKIKIKEFNMGLIHSQATRTGCGIEDGSYN